MAIKGKFALGWQFTGKAPVWCHDPALGDIGHVRSHDLAHDLRLNGGILNLNQGFDPPVEVATHPISRADENPRFLVRKPVPVSKTDNTRMFEKTAYNGFDADIFRQALYPGPEAANAPHHEADLHPSLACCIKCVNDIRLNKRVHLCPDICAFSGFCVLGLGGDHLKQPWLESQR